MIHNVDCMSFLPDMAKTRCIFADVPDNIGLNYVGYHDCRPGYNGWLRDFIKTALAKSECLWLSYNQMYDLLVKSFLYDTLEGKKVWHQVIWRYTFGQYNDNGLSSGYRPILRIFDPGFKFNWDSIRIESARMKLGDKRSAGPRVPDDVWDFARVVGNAKERRSWHPTQHPEALIERILKLSCTERLPKPGFEITDDPIGSVFDPFLGSGTTAIVAQRLGIPWEGTEISSFYCKMIQGELK